MQRLAGLARAVGGRRAAWAAVTVAVVAASAVTAFTLSGSPGKHPPVRQAAAAKATSARPASSAPRTPEATRKPEQAATPRPSGSGPAEPATPVQAAQPAPAQAPSPESAVQPRPSPPARDCYAGPHPTCVPPPPPSWMLHSSYISTPTS